MSAQWDYIGFLKNFRQSVRIYVCEDFLLYYCTITVYYIYKVLYTSDGRFQVLVAKYVRHLCPKERSRSMEDSQCIIYFPSARARLRFDGPN